MLKTVINFLGKLGQTWIGTYVEHVLHVVSGDERIVDGHNLDVGVVSGGAKHEATDATESVDTDLDSGPVSTKPVALNKRLES